ncbi:hypothetical protein XENTR_v10015267 [Xenopus tropicalis]|uniref:GATOR complex protein WDR24-like n=2 Tax=Xenopus tropicalis TaxID=8364 RepID=A0A803K0M3_XENTR|nr:GATOR complex protein WDR24-like [Xenopus tropicalis]XP_031757749.1 GATOR complex protein WDR24-like [Xenopus tropicalis]KAE8605659.1 hypothetical protein XENTR_v10015267 [Xenopus tropicalis]
MSRRRLEEAILRSKELGSCGESLDGGSEEESAGTYSDLFVRHHVPLAKDSHGIYSLRFCPNGKLLAAGFGNGAIQTVNVGGGGADVTLYSGHRTRQAVTALSYHPGSQNLLVAAGADGIISVYDIQSQLNVFSLTEQGNEINALDFSLDGSVFGTAGRDRNIRLYDSHTHQILQTVEAPDSLNDDDVSLTSGHTRRIFALRFHPEEHHVFVTGGWDNSVKVWDKRITKEARSVIHGPHICGPGIDIKGDMVVTGSWVARNALQLWDLRSSGLLQDVPFPASSLQGEFLYAARFASDTIVLAGGSGTSSACAINFRTKEVLGEVCLPNKAVHTVDVSPGGHTAAVAGAGGNLHVAEFC